MGEKHIDSYTKMTEETKTVLGDLFPMKRYLLSPMDGLKREQNIVCLQRKIRSFLPSKMSLLFHLRNLGLSS